jgi:hypothetical protein
MGYNTEVGGELTITPPLTWNEFKDSTFHVPTDAYADLDVKLAVTEETVDTDEGPLLRKTATALVPAWCAPFKAYHLLEHVQQAIDAFPGHTFSGHFGCSGEEAGDLWRVVVRDGRAVKVEPRIVWPDED